MLIKRLKTKTLWAAMLAVVTLGLPACSGNTFIDAMNGEYWATDFYLTFGNGVYINFREKTVREKVIPIVAGCLANGGGWIGPRLCVRNVFSLYHPTDHWGPFYADAYWQKGVSYYNDLWDHAISPSWYRSNHRCPTMHIDFTLDINWETHDCSW